MTTSTHGVRRTVAVAVAVAVAAVVSLAFAGTTSAQAQAKTTALTIAIRSCEGCEVTLISYTDADPDAGWSSDAHVVANGKAAFVVPTDKTVGMSVMVRTPWEGHTGYVTMVVFRYQGLAVGDRIGYNKARTMKKASGCWAGTNKREVTLRFKVRRVNVPGVHGKVPGNIACADHPGVAAADPPGVRRRARRAGRHPLQGLIAGRGGPSRPVTRPRNRFMVLLRGLVTVAARPPLQA